jgi:hypothetical protein
LRFVAVEKRSISFGFLINRSQLMGISNSTEASFLKFENGSKELKKLFVFKRQHLLNHLYRRRRRQKHLQPTALPIPPPGPAHSNPPTKHRKQRIKPRHHFFCTDAPPRATTTNSPAAAAKLKFILAMAECTKRGESEGAYSLLLSTRHVEEGS